MTTQARSLSVPGMLTVIVLAPITANVVATATANPTAIPEQPRLVINNFTANPANIAPGGTKTLEHSTGADLDHRFGQQRQRRGGVSGAVEQLFREAAGGAGRCARADDFLPASECGQSDIGEPVGVRCIRGLSLGRF